MQSFTDYFEVGKIYIKDYKNAQEGSKEQWYKHFKQNPDVQIYHSMEIEPDTTILIARVNFVSIGAFESDYDEYQIILHGKTKNLKLFKYDYRFWTELK